MNAFFSKQKIPAESQISKILDSFKDQRIISWIANNRETLTTEQYNFTLFMKEFHALFLDPVLSYDFPGSFWNGKYAEDNSGQERTKSGTLPVTDKDLASTYVLCRPSPTCP